MRSTLLSLYPRPFVTYMHTFGLFVMLVMIFLRTDPVIAQVESSEAELASEEKDHHRRIGIYFSGYAVYNNFCGWEGCDDNLPFSGLHTSIGYKNWQIISSWASDENEFIFNLNGRYNYHPLKKYRFRPFVFAGISTWYFNRKWSYLTSVHCHQQDHCDFVIFAPSKEDSYSESNDRLIRDRPDGKSMTLGWAVGFGIEYNIGRLIFSHEFDWYRDLAGCPYSDFICNVPDFKFLGIHFEF